ncbi:hypothetical protein C8J57DRAFT_683353 [Mycena rebaudengoi]|nr:hypothetical protein C8J57DRAFT_683353 [Mycena rebaudengoi]
MPLTEPVCIGQLRFTANISRPDPYLISQGDEWADVLIEYEGRNSGEGTLNLQVPKTGKSASRVFGSVDMKWPLLGPLYRKEYFRLDGVIRKGRANLPTLPLQVLIFTPWGNVPLLSTNFRKHGLLLEEPSPPFDAAKLPPPHKYYHNPHTSSAVNSDLPEYGAK